MTVSPAGVQLIKDFEGLRLKAYQCAAGRWTIGYGHTEDVKPHHVISSHQADVLLAYDLERFEADVSALTEGLALAQGQFDALVSFAYNVGSDIDSDALAEGLGDSTLLRKLRRGDVAGAADEFLHWTRATVAVDGKPVRVVLPGLKKRREAERALFLSQPPPVARSA